MTKLYIRNPKFKDEKKIKEHIEAQELKKKKWNFNKKKGTVNVEV